ncbi:hypothetical protein RhiXN_03213 [Rhizoctonia solani]|uniref:Translocon-associated protein subunit alpha n=1 Tax=Rhizoctonia solani TaxID=456999 RepID=A0A8H8NQZ6_9AGAM|nr:uncharacterized protein RhiXN_03213 [Rhizoctonia solani]QRW18289.1 hypothetical protein RhiXN_03213 [Rhizoctonia solani]
MRFVRTLSQIVLLASAACAAVVAPVEPKLDISASFGEENPFAQVVNGQSTKLLVKILNTSGANVTLVDIGGSYHDVDTGKTLRNVTARKFNLPIIEGMNLTFPYLLTSELRPKDTKLLVWANIKDSDANIFRMTAYDSIVSIVEPPSSIFDIQMILTYLMVLGLLGGGGYYAYLTANPPPKKKSGAPSNLPPTQVPLPETPGGAAHYEEEWIPSHHLAGSGARARKVSRGEALSSGDESASGKKKKGGKGR